MKLLASLTSPYARKIRVVLAEKKLPFELVVDSPWEANTRVPTLNPLGKVPVLVADDGETFFDSPVIVGYLETLGAEPRLLPAEPLACVRARQAEALADGITDAAVTALLESRRPDGERSAREIERQHDKIERGLVELEARVGSRRGFDGATLQIGDVAAGCALGYLDLRFPTLDWRGRHPALATYAARLLARPSFVDTTPPAG
ncbi:MAG: glutathione S-transferase [Thauera propionica]|jgi:glutathione S-transferase|uniref:glutathione S-transferase n=1 Tax=Thauera propionica TaxID=2019431 RepID=UPI0023F3579A|nr:MULTISPECIES: glutathione S-transferase [Thauera]MDD3675777.1 glutathione S-transferase [Thauera propionica]MDI3489212.1 glutathione S-transferase [Thauera sp.]MDY0046736.1 glutathione S-transferase [Thauera propionica]